MLVVVDDVAAPSSVVLVVDERSPPSEVVVVDRFSSVVVVVDRVDTGRGCFACMLGGPDRRTLFLLTAEGFEGQAIRRRTAAIEVVEVEVPGAGWP